MTGLRWLAVFAAALGWGVVGVGWAKTDSPLTIYAAASTREAVIAAMGKGEITPDDASTVAGVLEARRRALETVELEKRIDALEKESKT